MLLMTTTATWETDGDSDAVGAREYRAHHDSLHMTVRVLGRSTMFTVSENPASPGGFDSGTATNFDDAATRAEASAQLFLAADRPQRVVRTFSSAGPCLEQGRLLGETEQFMAFLAGGRKRRLKKAAGSAPHTEPCPSCTDHSKTLYPHGYED